VSSSSGSAQSGGVGFVGALTIAFIVLKLCGVIAWSWWWVLSPAWISAGLAVAVFVFLALAACGSVWFESLPAKRARKQAGKGKPGGPRTGSPFGPVRRWGYRPADVERLRRRAARADDGEALRGDTARLREDRERIGW
jgi:hypothetical protein